jgi:hypothetical protein
MASADLVQTNGLGLSLVSAMKRLMAVDDAFHLALVRLRNG